LEEDGLERGWDHLGLGLNFHWSVEYSYSVLWICISQMSIVNDLPADVTSAPSLSTFRKRLKLHLFPLSYPGLVL